MGRHRGSLHLKLLLLSLLSSGGCNAPDLWSPFDAADLVEPDTTQDGDIRADPLYCNDVSDCPVISDCCVTAMCVSNRCGWDVRPACCTEAGPCAATALHRRGQCEETCVPWGCVESLRLPETECGQTLAAFAGWPWGDMVAAYELRGVAGRLQWQLDARVPWDGGPSLVLADGACPVLQNRDAALPCDANPGEAEGFRAELWLPSVVLPENNTAVIQGFWHDGRATGGGLDTTARPQVRIESISASGAIRVLWSSEGENATDTDVSGWRPFAGEIAHPTAGGVRLRIVAEASAGNARPDRHFAFAGLEVRQPCALERVVAATAQPCGEAVAVPIQGLRDGLQVWMPDDAAIGCVPCANQADCGALVPCQPMRCGEDNHCIRNDMAAGESRSCCDFSETFGTSTTLPGDRAFWTGDDAWVDGVGPGGQRPTLHFPLGSLGDAPAGRIDSPVFTAPHRDPVLYLRLFLSSEWDLTTPAPQTLDVDRLTLSVVPTPFPGDATRAPSPIEVWTSGAIGGTTRGLWLPIRVPLPVAGGARFLLRLSFDAGDNDFNDFEGVHVAEIALGTRCRPCDTHELCHPDGQDPEAPALADVPIQSD